MQVSFLLEDCNITVHYGRQCNLDIPQRELAELDSDPYSQGEPRESVFTSWTHILLISEWGHPITVLLDSGISAGHPFLRYKSPGKGHWVGSLSSMHMLLFNLESWLLKADRSCCIWKDLILLMEGTRGQLRSGVIKRPPKCPSIIRGKQISYGFMVIIYRKRKMKKVRLKKVIQHQYSGCLIVFQNNDDCTCFDCYCCFVMVNYVISIDHPHTHKFTYIHIWKLLFSYSIIALFLHIRSSTYENCLWNYSFKKKKRNLSSLANVPGQIIPFPFYPVHHKSSEEIMFKFN